MNPQKYPREKIWTHKILTRKNVGPTKLLSEYLLIEKLQRSFIAYITTYIDREINNSKVWNICGHEDRTWTPNSLVFLESLYFYFNYRYCVNPRYHLINTNQGVPTENFKKLQKDKILQWLCNLTEGLLFLLMFYTAHTVTRTAAREKIHETLITNMLHVWVHYIIYEISYEHFALYITRPRSTQPGFYRGRLRFDKKRKKTFWMKGYVLNSPLPLGCAHNYKPKQLPECFVKKGVLKNFAHVFSLAISEILKNIYFEEHLQKAASK